MVINLLDDRPYPGAARGENFLILLHYHILLITDITPVRLFGCSLAKTLKRHKSFSPRKRRSLFSIV